MAHNGKNPMKNPSRSRKRLGAALVPGNPGNTGGKRGRSGRPKSACVGSSAPSCWIPPCKRRSRPPSGTGTLSGFVSLVGMCLKYAVVEPAREVKLTGLAALAVRLEQMPLPELLRLADVPDEELARHLPLPDEDDDAD